VWQRHDLTSMKLCLKALEAKMAQDGILLTEAQIVAKARTRLPNQSRRSRPTMLTLLCPRSLCRKFPLLKILVFY